MLVSPRTLLSSAIATLLISAIAPPPANTQPSQYCGRDGNYEPAATTTRTVELRDFGVAVDIPENYRTMRREDGTVLILHPDDFAWLQCLARGGIGGGGYYSEQISLVQRDPSIELWEQTAWSTGYRTNPDGTRRHDATSVARYQRNGIEGYVATSSVGTSAIFLGPAPGSNQLLQVLAVCDCEVEAEDVTDLLSRIRPLQ